MQRAVAWVLLLTLVASASPLPVIAEEATTTPEVVVVPESAVEPVADPITDGEMATTTDSTLAPEAPNEQEIASSTEEITEPEGERVEEDGEAGEVLEMLRAMAFESSPALEPGEQYLVNQDGAGETIIFQPYTSDIFINPPPVYTALASGTSTKVRLYLARNQDGINGFPDHRLLLQAYEATSPNVVCTITAAGENFTSQALRENFAAIPVGDESDIVLVEFDEELGDCFFEEGTSYSFRLEYRLMAGPPVAEPTLYTKGANTTNEFFVQIIGDAPVPPPPPTLPPEVPGTILAQSPAFAWDENGWDTVSGFGYNAVGFSGPIEQEGVITHLVVPLAFGYDALNAPLKFYLNSVNSFWYPCETPEKTLAEWGIFNDTRSNGLHFNTVTIGPFSGPGCDTVLRHTPTGDGVSLGVSTSEPFVYQNVGGNLLVPIHRDENGAIDGVPYIFYSADPEPPACTENCFSNVLFLPGFLGSRLYTTNEFGQERSLWEPNGKRDLEDLALNTDGTSKLPVYVGEPVDTVHNLPIGVTIYGELMEHLEDISGNEPGDKIAAWDSYPYDWRYDVFDVVDDGTIKQDGSREYLIPTLETLAESSRTEKVTIIAHSNGGLLAKVLMLRLAAEGKADLVDKIVMVGSPQTGTPQGLLGLLHGDKIFPPFVALGSEARKAAATMPGAYGLAPSAEYFNSVSTPVAMFAPGSQTDAMRSQYGDSLDSYTEMVSFMQNVPATRSEPGEQDEETPLPLPVGLINIAEATHAELDAWTPPAGVEVHEVVGWGNDTAIAARYYTETTFSCPTGPLSCGMHPSIDYKPLHVNDGDDTVVSTSAAYMDRTTFFNLAELGREVEFRRHDDLTASSKFHQYFDYLLGIEDTYRTDLFVENEPDGEGIEFTTVSIHSPAIFSLKDEDGNETGIFPVPGSDLYYMKEEIPYSFVFFGGEGKYVSAPAGKSYEVRVQGTGNGTFDLTVEDENEEVVEHFDDVPVNPNTVATTDLSSETASTLVVDENGDGQPDLNVAPEGGVLTLAELITNLKTAVNGLSTTNPNQKTKLLNKITNIENKIEKQKQKQAKVVGKLQAQIAKKAGKGKIDAATANSISSLLDELLAQSSLVPLDTALIQQLKEQIAAANITAQLKTSLLNKIARLESLAGVTRSLNTMTQAVQRKGVKGILNDAEVQNLLNLLDQLQGAL